jgi:TrmH family RNA methyltransferase
MKKITSVQNHFIKSLILLREKPRARRENNLAFNGGYTIEIILFYPKIYPLEKAQKLSGKSEIIEINKEVFNKLAYRESTGGLIAVARTKDLGISKLKLSDNSLILIAEATEKPGNIGALLRTADAANLDAVVIANPKCDIYNPNVIRSSVGCIFTNQIIVCDSKDVIHFLKENNIRLFCASLQNSTSYNNQNYKESTAIVVGNETHGLSDFWLDLGTNIKIPMRGKIDSMNVSVSAAVLIFEAIRQREFS